MVIAHHEYQNGGEFIVETDGVPVGRMTYRRVGDVLYVDHTEVDEELRGHGVARKLLDEAVAYARGSGEKIVPLCSYTRAKFKSDPSLADVLKGYPK